MTRHGLVVDVSRCTGCYACVVACKAENGTRPEVSWLRIEEEEEGEFPKVSKAFTPLMCMQCTDMPCAEGCPTGAIYKGEGGIILVDADTCTCGGSPCVESCPFGVMSVNRGRKSYFEDQDTMEGMVAYEAHRDGVAEKCTLCHHRLKEGDVPFCVQACPTKALIFGDLDDQASDVSRLIQSGSALALKGDLLLDVSVFYKKTR